MDADSVDSPVTLLLAKTTCLVTIVTLVMES